MREPVIHDSDSEDELERSLVVRAFRFIVTRVANSLEEEEEEEGEKEEMPLERKMSLCELLTGRAKGLVLKDASGS